MGRISMRPRAAVAPPNRLGSGANDMTTDQTRDKPVHSTRVARNNADHSHRGINFLEQGRRQ